MNRTRVQYGAGLLLLGCLGAAVCEAQEGSVQTARVVTEPHTIDRVYRSMVGPGSTVEFTLTEDAEPELVWVRRARLTILQEGRPASSEFLCHSNFWSQSTSIYASSDAAPEPERKTAHAGHGMEESPGFKFLDINQGALDIAFPEGFGIPLMSSEPLAFHAMLMNQAERESPFELQVQAELDYVRDRDLTEEMKVLDLTVIATELTIGEESRDHWLVPPGRHVLRDPLEGGLRIPQDTTVHAINVHLHPYAESLELWDATAGRSVFKAQASSFSDRIGVERVDQYASTEGIPIAVDHDYEMIAVYNNPTDVRIDAMGMMYLFYWEPNFTKPVPPQR